MYDEDDIEWLELCLLLRDSGMPLPAIRAYTTLVRDGDGNEPERLALLRAHRERVREEIRHLTKCLDLISFKVGVYEDIVAQSAGGSSCHEAEVARGQVARDLAPEMAQLDGPRPA